MFWLKCTSKTAVLLSEIWLSVADSVSTEFLSFQIFVQKHLLLTLSLPHRIGRDHGQYRLLEKFYSFLFIPVMSAVISINWGTMYSTPPGLIISCTLPWATRFFISEMRRRFTFSFIESLRRLSRQRRVSCLLGRGCAGLTNQEKELDCSRASLPLEREFSSDILHFFPFKRSIQAVVSFARFRKSVNSPLLMPTTSLGDQYWPEPHVCSMRARTLFTSLQIGGGGRICSRSFRTKRYRSREGMTTVPALPPKT